MNAKRARTHAPALEAEEAPPEVLGALIDEFDAEVAEIVRAALPILRRRFGTCDELVYDSYNALAIGWTPNGRTSEVIVSLAIYARGVNLYFMRGAKLDDPHRLLGGAGTQGRFLRLDDAVQLESPEVSELLDTATAFGKTRPPASGRMRTFIKMLAEKKRARRGAG